MVRLLAHACPAKVLAARVGLVRQGHCDVIPADPPRDDLGDFAKIELANIGGGDDQQTGNALRRAHWLAVPVAGVDGAGKARARLPSIKPKP